MPNINQLFTSKYIRVDDIEALADESTDTATLTIDRVEMETVGQDEVKPVVYFREIKNQGLVLNKTNATSIGRLHGLETDNWGGKRVGLFTTEVEYQGKSTMGIRVRLKAPKTAKPAVVSVATDDESGENLPF